MPPHPKVKLPCSGGSETKGRFKPDVARVGRCAGRLSKARHPSKKTAEAHRCQSYFACETKNSDRGYEGLEKKQSAVRRLVTAAQWEHWQVLNIDTNAREGHEITQHVKLPRCTAAPVPVCVAFRPLEFQAPPDERSEKQCAACGSLEKKMFSLSVVVMGVLRGKASCQPPH